MTSSSESSLSIENAGLSRKWPSKHKQKQVNKQVNNVKVKEKTVNNIIIRSDPKSKHAPMEYLRTNDQREVILDLKIVLNKYKPTNVGPIALERQAEGGIG